MVRRIIRILAVILAAMVLLVAGLIAYLRNADLSLYQDQVESFLSGRIGHDLQIGGRFELHVGSTTTLIAVDVTLSNTNWPGNSPLVRVGYLEFGFDTWSLVSAPFRVEALVVRDVKGWLDQNADGDFNWATGKPERSDPGVAPFDLNRVAFHNVNIEGVDFAYVHPARERPVRVIVERLTVSPDENEVLDLDLRGSVNDLDLMADGKLGPWRNFVDGKNIFADLDLTLGPLSLDLDGTVGDIVHLEGIELDGNLSGTDVAGLLGELELPPFAEGALELTVRVQQQQQGHSIRLDGNVGAVQLTASGQIDSLLAPRSSSFDVDLVGPDAGRLAMLLAIDGVPAEPFELSGAYFRDGTRVGFEEALLSVGQNTVRFRGAVDMGVLDLDVEIAAKGPDFSIVGPFTGLNGLPAEPFEMSGRLTRDGVAWVVDQVDATIGQNRLRAHGRVRGGGAESTRIELTASGPDLSVVQDFTALEGIPEGPYEIGLALRSHPDGIEVVQATGAFGDNRVDASGVLNPGPGFAGSEGRIRVTGPNFHNVALLSGVPYLPSGPFDVQGQLSLGIDEIVLTGVTASVGSLAGTAAGRVGLGEGKGDFDLGVTLRGPDLAGLPGMNWNRRFAGDPFRVRGSLSRNGDELLARDLDVSIGNLDAKVDGRIVGRAEIVTLKVEAEAEDASVIRKLAELERLPAGPVTLGGGISRVDDAITFSNVTLGIGEHRVSIHGLLHLEPLENDSDLALSVSGPSLADTGQIYGVPALPDKPFSAQGQFRGTPTGLEVDGFAARLGDSDLSGDFHVNLEQKPLVAGYLSSTHMDISDSLARRKAPEDRAPESDSVDRPRLFSDAPLDTSWLQKADLDIQIRLGTLVANTVRVNDVDVGIELHDSALRVEPIFLRQGRGSIEAMFHLAPNGDQYALRTWVEIDDVHFGLMSDENQDVVTLPLLDGEILFEGTGESLRSIMGSANGRIALHQGPGRVREVFGAAIFKDVIVQALRSLNPRRDKVGQELECAFYDATIEDGVLRFDRIAIQTAGMTVVASGRIRLASERIDMTFRAKPREGLGVSLGTVANSFLAIGGTLSDPTISLDPGRSATTTGVAVATGGLSLLARGLWDRVTAEANICEDRRR